MTALRLHTAFWTTVFFWLACADVLSIIAALALPNVWVFLTAGAVTAGAITVCRIRYVQLYTAAHAGPNEDDEAFIRALRGQL